MVDHLRAVRTPALLIVLGLLGLVACAGDDPGHSGDEPADPTVDAAPDADGGVATPDPAPDDPAAVPSDDGPPVDDPAAPEGPAVDPAEVGADELGMIPVLMYHRLLEDGGGEYDLTPEEFRAELTWLFDHGYRPITTAQLVRGEIDVPAGTTPVVLTFDDSTRSQAALTADGRLDPDTALGILLDVAAGYEDVEPRASVYVITSSLFGGTADGERVLALLHDLGMELGNHTHSHRPLRTLSPAEVREELAANVAAIRALVPDAEVATMSLPLGVFPEDRSLVAAGTSAVGDYRNEGVLLVGAGPSASPFGADFDPLAIPRIRSSPSWDGGEPDFGSAFWLEQLDLGRSYRRFVSDGDPDTISFPAERADELDPRYADRANPY